MQPPRHVHWHVEDTPNATVGVLQQQLPRIPGVQRLKLLPPDIRKPRGDARAEERPGFVALRAGHEEVVDPEAGEEVARARLLRAVVLPQLQELKHVRVPRLEVHREGAAAAAAALAEAAHGGVEEAERGDKAVGGAAGAAAVACSGGDRFWNRGVVGDWEEGVHVKGSAMGRAATVSAALFI